MAKIPTLRQNPVGFRSPASSTQYNEMHQQTLDDIITLFDTANQLERELTKAQEAFELVNRFQHMHIRELENRVYQLEEDIRRLQRQTGKKTLYVLANQMMVSSQVPAQERAYLDTTYEVAHLPITGKSVSKVYIYDEVTQQIAIPSSLKVEVLPKEKNGWRIEENSPLLALNGNNHTFWHRKVIMPLEDNPSKPVTCEFIITLPDTIIANREVNTITINPFPLHSLRIDKIEYRMDGDWTLLPGWEVDPDTHKPIPKSYAGNLKFCFPDTAMSQIKITMTQFNWFEENHQKVYHFGLQEVGVFYNDYQSQMGRIEIPVTLAVDSQNRLITGLHPIFTNASALSDPSDFSSVFTYNFYTVDDYGQIHYTKDRFPILVSGSQLLIKATIHRDPYNGAVPTLKGIELTYEDV